jgi:hypothetical protein
MNNFVIDTAERRIYSKIKFLFFLLRHLNFNKEEIVYHNFARCPVWVRNLVADIEGGT